MTTDSAGMLRAYMELGNEARPQLIRWSTWGAAPGNFDSYALLVPGGPVLIDPVAPLPSTGTGLWERLGARPQASVLTNDYHERDAYAIRDCFGAPVWAPAAGLPARGGELEGQPDRTYEDGEVLPCGLRARKIAGRFAGDTILVWTAPSGECVFFTGDTLNGHFNPDNPRPHPRRDTPGLYLGAGRFYLQGLDADALKASLRALLAEQKRVDLICGAHGQPWRDDPRGALTRLLDLNWAIFLAAARHPVVLEAQRERDPNGFLKAPPKHMHVFNDVWESGHFRTNRAYHYRDLELGPALDRTVHTAFRDEATMKDALIEANRLGNSQVEFGERCYKPAWKRR